MPRCNNPHYHFLGLTTLRNSRFFHHHFTATRVHRRDKRERESQSVSSFEAGNKSAAVKPYIDESHTAVREEFTQLS